MEPGRLYETRVRKRIQSHQRQNKVRMVLAVLASLVFCMTTYALILPAISMDTQDDTGLYLVTDCLLELYPKSTQPQDLDLTMKESERICLKANNSLLGDWDWQIYSFQDQKWISFYQENQSSIILYPAKLAGMLNETQQACIRLQAVLDGMEYQSACVNIQLVFDSGSQTCQSAQTQPEIWEAEVLYFTKSNAGMLEESDEAQKEPAETDTFQSLTEFETEMAEEQDGKEEEKGQEAIFETDETGESEPAEQTFAFTGSFKEGASLVLAKAVQITDTPERLLDESGTGYHTVTITFRDAQGNAMGRGDWIGHYGTGVSMNETIEVPLVEGYTATLQGEEVSSVVLEGELAEDITYDVVYIPGTTTYTILYYLQDVGSSTYSLACQEQKEGTTGSVAPDPEKTFEGFSARVYTLPVLAADGSTVLEIQYDRLYCKMVFELNGGTGVSDFYGQYGQRLQIADPVMAGYDFAGWSLDAAGDLPVSLPETIPAADCVWYANWTAGQASYCVLLWKWDSDQESYVYAGQISGLSAATGQTIAYQDVEETVSQELEERSLLEYYQPDPDLSQEVTVKGDGSSRFHVYLNPRQYLLRFIYARSYAIGSSVRWQVSATNNTWSKTKGTDPISDLGQLGWVSTSPVTLSDTLPEGLSSGSFTKKTGSITYTYYYLDLMAGWEDDISAVWPSSPFNKAGSYTFVSWGTYFGTPYQQANTNPNIKGIYGTMDAAMVIDPDACIALDEEGLAQGSPVQYFAAYWKNGSVYTYDYEIYAEALEDTPQEKIVTYQGKDYVLYKVLSGVLSTDTIYNQSTLSFKGLDASGALCEADPASGTIRFYYPRTCYTLSLLNGYGSTMEIQVPWQSDLGSFQVWEYTLISEDGTRQSVSLEKAVLLEDLIPSYPSSLAAGAWQFSGQWYLDVQSDEDGNRIFSEDLLYDFSQKKMGATPLALYAKWDTAEVTVNFWMDESLSMQAYDSQILSWNTTPLQPQDPQWEGRQFQGWYYWSQASDPEVDEEGNVITDEQGNPVYSRIVAKVSFATTTFTQDTDIFALWDEDVYMEYVFHFVTFQDGQEVTVAEDVRGQAKAGSAVIQQAKTGQELYAAYASGYFPQTASSSLLMDARQRSGNMAEYTFVYTQVQEVPYKIVYAAVMEDALGNPMLDEEGNFIVQSLLDSVTVTDNTDAVITQNAREFEGYVLADGTYQQTKVLTWQEDQDAQALLEANTLTFYYIQSDTPCQYTVEYYVQNQSGEFVLEESVSAWGMQGREVSAIEKTIAGYLYDASLPESLASGILSQAQPLVLKLFYRAMEVTVVQTWSQLDPQPVVLDIYIVNSQSDAKLAQFDSITLDESTGWSQTFWLPWPEGDSVYAIEEQSGQWKTDYSPSRTIFIEGQETRAGAVDLAESVTIQIKNSKTFALPSTGGTSWLFAAGGALCFMADIGLALVVLHARRFLGRKDIKKNRRRNPKQHPVA